MSFAERFADEMLRSPASIGGVGAGVATLLLLILALSLPAERRRLLRLPLSLVAAHIGLIGLVAALPEDWAGRRATELLAYFLALAAIARAAFVLALDTVLDARLGQRPPKIVRDLLLGVVLLGVVMASLQHAGVEATSLLTTSAVVTAVIGLSLQETLGNVFAGLALQAQRPFEVGDWIQIDGSEAQLGRVLEINWRATTILTEAQAAIMVPNGVIAKASITNFTKPTIESRHSVLVQGHYDAPPERVRAILLDAVRSVPEVLAEPAPTVVTADYADSGITYECRFFIERFASRRILQGVVRDRIWYAMRREGVEIPYPQRTTHLHVVDDAARARVDAERTLRFLSDLEEVALFRPLGADDRRRLAEQMTERIHGAGETIFREGDPGEALFVVERGEVAIRRARAPGEPSVEVARLGPGAFFGEASLMTGAPRGATAETTAETRAAVIDKAAFREILLRSPEVAEPISRILAERQAAVLGPADRPESSADEAQPTLLRRTRAFFAVG